MRDLEKIMEGFKNHQLTLYTSVPGVRIYKFAQPGTNILSQQWIFCGNTLVVTGDCYDSIYIGGGVSSITIAAKCALDYFSGLCRADGDGRDQSKFDQDAATESIHEAIVNNWESYGLYQDDDPMEYKLSQIEGEDDTLEIPRLFEDEIDTVTWCRENEQLVGEDWFEYVKLTKKNIHPYFHLAALRVAAKQIEDEGKTG